MKYVIMGAPIPLARPRFSKKTVFDSQKHKKLIMGIHLRNQHQDKPMYTGNLHMDIVFYLISPSVRKHGDMEEAYHVKRPDLSNLIKFVEDIGTGILYEDDALICSLTATKKYSKEPRTEFEITVL